METFMRLSVRLLLGAIPEQNAGAPRDLSDTRAPSSSRTEDSDDNARFQYHSDMEASN